MIAERIQNKKSFPERYCMVVPALFSTAKLNRWPAHLFQRIFGCDGAAKLVPGVSRRVRFSSEHGVVAAIDGSLAFEKAAVEFE